MRNASSDSHVLSNMRASVYAHSLTVAPHDLKQLTPLPLLIEMGIVEQVNMDAASSNGHGRDIFVRLKPLEAAIQIAEEHWQRLASEQPRKCWNPAL